MLRLTPAGFAPPLSEDEAVELAKQAFNEEAHVKTVEYLTAVGAHHEFRENPLPAYAVRFEHPTRTTVYVSTELGTVQKFRNDFWRVFDFLWMFHTMDYRGRDDFNNCGCCVFFCPGFADSEQWFCAFCIDCQAKKENEKRISSQ